MELVLRENPFYAESGGQVSDVGGVAGPGWSLPVDAVRKDAKGTVVGGTFARELRARHGPGGGGRTQAARHRAEPQRHAPGALRAPEAPGHPRAAAGLPGGTRPAAVRLLAPRPDRRRHPARHRAGRQRARAGQRAGRHARDGLSRRAGARRDGVLQREVRRPGARGADGTLDRALRRHPRPHDRPGRHVPHFRPERRGGRRAADRGAHGHGRAPRRARAGAAAGSGGRRTQGATRAPGPPGGAAARGAPAARGPAGGGAPFRRRRHRGRHRAT